MAPLLTRQSRSVRALVRLPLWAEGKAAGVEIDEQRLHVAQDGIAAGRVADVAHAPCRPSAARSPSAVVKLSPTRPTRRSVWKWCAVEADDAGGFLAAMLERMQAERGQGRGIGMTEDAEDAALLAQPVLVEPVQIGPSQRRTLLSHGPSASCP